MPSRPDGQQRVTPPVTTSGGNLIPVRSSLEETVHHLTSLAGRLAADIVNVKPNASHAPGTALAQQLLGGVAFYGLLACVLGLIGSVAYWGMGSFSGNPHAAGRGKLGVAVCIGGAVLIGSAGALISWAAGRAI